jgi:hypothetical protein
MQYKYIGREPNPAESWKAADLRPKPADRADFPGLSLTHLANLACMSLSLTAAYETRLRPDAIDHAQLLFNQLRSLTPEDLGRFWALEQANAAYFIVSKALSEPERPPRITVLALPNAWPGTVYAAAPDMECCDAYGQSLNVLRPNTLPYRRALGYLDTVDVLVETALGIPSTERTARNDAFRGAWADAGQELLAKAKARDNALVIHGPDIHSLTDFAPPYEQPPHTP